jgi:hypothetical protein
VAYNESWRFVLGPPASESSVLRGGQAWAAIPASDQNPIRMAYNGF